MDLFQKLTILNCITSSLTLIFVLVAILPHVKQGAVVVRDAMLWVLLIGAIGTLAWMGAQRVIELENRGGGVQAFGTTDSAPSDTRGGSWSDRYYAGSH